MSTKNKDLELKNKLYHTCVQELESKVQSVLLVLSDLRASAANETKSTAGDKHETALAMLQLEQENKRQQLKILQEQQAILNRIDVNKITHQVGLGSLIKTSTIWFYITVALGKVTVDEQMIYVISAVSPLAKLLFGKQSGQSVSFQQNTYQIESLI
ncbi:MAG: hypothetical protein WEA59_04515 [Ferruginibacter sp.]